MIGALLAVHPTPPPSPHPHLASGPSDRGSSKCHEGETEATPLEALPTTWAEQDTVSWPSCSSSCSTWVGPGAGSPPGAVSSLFPSLWLGELGLYHHPPQPRPHMHTPFGDPRSPCLSWLFSNQLFLLFLLQSFTGLELPYHKSLFVCFVRF